MEILALNVAVILLHALTVVAIPAMVTPIKRDLPYYTGNDTASESFIGYTYDGEWIVLDCYDGDYLSISENYGGCIPNGVSTLYGIAKSCLSGSIQVITSGVSYTCATACATVLLYPNLDKLNATTFIPCDSMQYTSTIYRATTSSGQFLEQSSGLSTASIAAAVTTSMPSQTASNTAITQSTTTIPSSPNDGNDSSNPDNDKSVYMDIGLGVGLGVGLPSLFAALTICYIFGRREKKPRTDPKFSDKQVVSNHSQKEMILSELGDGQGITEMPSSAKDNYTFELGDSTRAELSG